MSMHAAHVNLASGIGGARLNRSLTAAAEKRVLVWMATRLPRAVTSDHLTLLGLTASFGIGVAFAVTPAWPWAPALAVPLLALNWLGDSLDGTLARVRREERPRYGFYVDHVIDVAGVSAMGAGLMASGLMEPTLALGVALAYVLLAAESFLATHTAGTFRMSFGPFGPTELRIVLAAGALKVAQSPLVTIGSWEVRLFDVGGVIAVLGMLAAFLFSAVRTTRSLFIAETRKTPSSGDDAT